MSVIHLILRGQMFVYITSIDILAVGTNADGNCGKLNWTLS